MGGLSELAAEEMVCWEHELYALRTSGMPLLQWAPQAWLLLDNRLCQIEDDLCAVPASELTAVQRRTLQRAQLMRQLFTGAKARALLLLLGAALPLALTSSLFARLVVMGGGAWVSAFEGCSLKSVSDESPSSESSGRKK